jgi:RNA polymerase sigma-70 factor (ECF subfamily)
MTDAGPTDSELLAACTTGDEHALASLYDRHGKRAYGVALHLLREPALAEEAVHDAFVAIWRDAATYDVASETASTWILTLVHRRAVELVRRHHRFDAPPAEPAATMPRTALGVEVRAALRLLPTAEREVLELAYWGGLTQSEIATATGIPPGTLKSLMRDALSALRDAVRRAADGDVVVATARGAQS